MTSGGALLRVKIELAWPAVQAATRRLWAAPGVAARYPEYLFAMHLLAAAASPLAGVALVAARARAARDPVAAGLVGYLRAQAGEERGHERWPLEDLAALGHDPDEPRRRAAPPAVAALVGAAYYWVIHRHPVALLGYITVLRTQPPQPDKLDRLAARTGLPAAAFQTLRRHADPAGRGRDEPLALLDRLPLRADHHALVGLSALWTAQGLCAVLDRLTRQPLTRQPLTRQPLPRHP